MRASARVGPAQQRPFNPLRRAPSPGHPKRPIRSRGGVGHEPIGNPEGAPLEWSAADRNLSTSGSGLLHLDQRKRGCSIRSQSPTPLPTAQNAKGPRLAPETLRPHPTRPLPRGSGGERIRLRGQVRQVIIWSQPAAPPRHVPFTRRSTLTLTVHTKIATLASATRLWRWKRRSEELFVLRRGRRAGPHGPPVDRPRVANQVST